VDRFVGDLDHPAQHLLNGVAVTLRDLVPPAMEFAEDGLGGHLAGQGTGCGPTDTIGNDDYEGRGMR
jgi:hypothetical protein